MSGIILTAIGAGTGFWLFTLLISKSKGLRDRVEEVKRIEKEKNKKALEKLYRRSGRKEGDSTDI